MPNSIDFTQGHTFDNFIDNILSKWVQLTRLEA